MPDQTDDVICNECQALYEEVADRARKPGIFEKVRRTDKVLRCTAQGAAAEAHYIVEVETPAHNRVWIGLYTLDRWLSESIEADLMHLGDKLEDLLDEELVDQGFEAGPLPVEHFRDEAKRYVFRSPIDLPEGEELDGPAMIDRVTQTLLAYEACFRQLGDMEEDDEA